MRGVVWGGVLSDDGKRANNEKQTWLWHEVMIFAVTLAPAHDLRTVAMNQPSRAEKFVLPDGVRKLTFTRDTKVANAGTYVVQKEDHTLGNIVRMCVPVPIVPPLHRVEPASTREPTR
jgi:hypothetical protein